MKKYEVVTEFSYVRRTIIIDAESEEEALQEADLFCDSRRRVCEREIVALGGDSKIIRIIE
jgi:hypothetical protein